MTGEAQKVGRLFKREKVVQTVIVNLAGARPDGGETKVLELVRATGLAAHEVVHVLKALGNCGCGTFIVGRRGAKSRMRWSVDPQQLLGAATAELEELPAFEADRDLDVEPAHAEAAPARAGRRSKNGELLTHIYNLRPGLVVRFELPSSLTRSEADRLAKFVLSLPFE